MSLKPHECQALHYGPGILRELPGKRLCHTFFASIPRNDGRTALRLKNALKDTPPPAIKIHNVYTYICPAILYRPFFFADRTRNKCENRFRSQCPRVCVAWKPFFHAGRGCLQRRWWRWPREDNEHKNGLLLSTGVLEEKFIDTCVVPCIIDEKY